MTQENAGTTLTERLDRATETLDKLFDSACVLRQALFNLHETMVDLANDLEELENNSVAAGEEIAPYLNRSKPK